MRLPALLRSVFWQFKQRSFEKRMNERGWVFWCIRQYPDGTEKHVYRHLFR